MRLLSRFATGTLVGFSVSSLIALASYSLGLWLGRNTVAGTVILCIAGVFLTEPLYNVFAHNQQLTVAFVTPIETPTEQLEVDPENLGFNNANEIQMAKNEVLERVRALDRTHRESA